MQANQTVLLGAEEIRWKIRRMAWEIAEAGQGCSKMVLVGIAPRGNVLAERLAQEIARTTGLEVEWGVLHIDKDDPIGSPLRLEINLESCRGATVVVVDDVLNTGRTLLHALKPFLDIPLCKLRTAVLVDRDHKTFPVRADVAGMVLSTSLREHVRVELGDRDSVVLL
ncbi:phosphoribosyltransferase [bacterium]|nr:phosphoribosyltransferase [bacterium]